MLEVSWENYLSGCGLKAFQALHTNKSGFSKKLLRIYANIDWCEVCLSYKFDEIYLATVELTFISLVLCARTDWNTILCVTVWTNAIHQNIVCKVRAQGTGASKDTCGI